MPAPVLSRSSLTIAAVIAILGSPQNIISKNTLASARKAMLQ